MNKNTQNDDCFAHWIAKAHFTFKNRLSQDLKQYNLTVLQRQILLLLFENDSMTQRQICEETISEASNMTATLKRMEQNDYICKVKHPEDKRAVLIRPTKKAFELQEQLEEFGNNDEFLFDGIDEKDQETVVKVLKEIYKNSLQEQLENKLK